MSNDGKIGILLVEDNPDDAEITLRTLNKGNLGNPIVWVKDGEEALDCLFRHTHPEFDESGGPGLILLDLRLPKFDGMEVLEQIKRDASTSKIPVVVLTSSTQQEDIDKCYALGVNSYVSKPVKFEAFVETVSKLGMYWLLVNTPPVRAD
ncbi:MAG: response regulator [Pseudomonadota bacterium]